MGHYGVRYHGFDRLLAVVCRRRVVSLGALSGAVDHAAPCQTRREISGDARFGASTRRLRYPGLVPGSADLVCPFRYHPDDIYPACLGASLPSNLLAHKRFRAPGEKEEISWHDIVGDPFDEV